MNSVLKFALVCCLAMIWNEVIPVTGDKLCNSYYHDTYGTTGQCQTSSTCPGGKYITGKCPGSASNTCCFTSNSDSNCASYDHSTYGEVGYCVDTDDCPDNAYQSNLCPTKPADVKCCFKPPDPCEAYTLVTRSEWEARSPVNSLVDITNPVLYVFIHHTDGATCSTDSECKSRVKGIQNYHMDAKGWDDIGYSFLVGGNGKIYEGRGWDKQGAHTAGYNDVGLAFSFIGDFGSSLPETAALKAAANAIACGVKNGHISSSYILRGHKDMGATSCPGTEFYDDIVKKWPHY